MVGLQVAFVLSLSLSRSYRLVVVVVVVVVVKLTHFSDKSRDIISKQVELCVMVLICMARSLQ